jgi:hypothetical protein
MDLLLIVGIGLIVAIGLVEAALKGPSHLRRALSDRATNHTGSFDDPRLRHRTHV